MSLGKDGAADWQLLEKVGALLEPDDSVVSIDHSLFNWGNWNDYQSASLTRVANTKLLLAQGLDPCPDRLIKRPKPPSFAEYTVLIDEAEELLDRATKICDVALAEDLGSSNSANKRAYHAETYRVLAILKELKGDIPAAFKAIQHGREVRIALAPVFQTRYQNEWERLRNLADAQSQ
jgi:hypothetical protein